MTRPHYSVAVMFPLALFRVTPIIIIFIIILLPFTMKFSSLARPLSSRLSSTSSRHASSLSSVKPITATYWCGDIVYENNKVAAGSVDVRQGVITGLHPGESYRDAKFRAQPHFYDLGEAYCLMPGLIDVHTHISALGRDWEGYTSATAAAAAGGFTTLMNMPLNSLPPTVNMEALHLEQQAANDAHLFLSTWDYGVVFYPTRLTTCLACWIRPIFLASRPFWHPCHRRPDMPP